MAFGIVDQGEGSAINGGNVTLTFASVQSGDTVYVWGGTQTTAHGPATAGYTVVDTVVHGSSNIRMSVWRKRMGSSPDTSVVCSGDGNANNGVVYEYYAFRDADESSPEDVAPTKASGSSSAPNNPAITPVTSGAIIVAAAAYRSPDGTVTAPTGYGNLIDLAANDVSDYAAFAAAKTKNPPGSDDPAAWSGTDAGVPNWVAITFAVRPAGAGGGGGGGSGTASKRAFPIGNVDNLFPNLASRTEPVV